MPDRDRAFVGVGREAGLARPAMQVCGCEECVMLGDSGQAGMSNRDGVSKIKRGG